MLITITMHKESPPNFHIIVGGENVPEDHEANKRKIRYIVSKYEEFDIELEIRNDGLFNEPKDNIFKAYQYLKENGLRTLCITSSNIKTLKDLEVLLFKRGKDTEKEEIEQDLFGRNDGKSI